MNALCALTTGFGIGLASLGGLWLTIHYAVRRPRGRAALALGQLLRLSLAAAGFYAVSREGPGIPAPEVHPFLGEPRIYRTASTRFSPSPL
ncbi:MAG: ATP synthase subunit I, partial [Deltaproteobacteria bacterium]